MQQTLFGLVSPVDSRSCCLVWRFSPAPAKARLPGTAARKPSPPAQRRRRARRAARPGPAPYRPKPASRTARPRSRPLGGACGRSWRGSCAPGGISVHLRTWTGPLSGALQAAQHAGRRPPHPEARSARAGRRAGAARGQPGLVWVGHAAATLFGGGRDKRMPRPRAAGYGPMAGSGFGASRLLPCRCARRNARESLQQMGARSWISQSRSLEPGVRQAGARGVASLAR